MHGQLVRRWGLLTCDYPIAVYSDNHCRATHAPLPLLALSHTPSDTGACGGSVGRRVQRYTVSAPATLGGSPCLFQDGAQSLEDCVNIAGCDALPCNFTWLAGGDCTGGAACRALNCIHDATIRTPDNSVSKGCKQQHNYVDARAIKQSCR